MFVTITKLSILTILKSVDTGDSQIQHVKADKANIMTGLPEPHPSMCIVSAFQETQRHFLEKETSKIKKIFSYGYIYCFNTVFIIQSH